MCKRWADGQARNTEDQILPPARKCPRAEAYLYVISMPLRKVRSIQRDDIICGVNQIGEATP